MTKMEIDNVTGLVFSFGDVFGYPYSLTSAFTPF